MKIIYRTSSGGYNKIKPVYINNKNCLENFIANFDTPDLIIADNVSDEYYFELLKYGIEIDRTMFGSGGKSFKYMMEAYIQTNKITSDSDEIIYFVENDYLHKPNSKQVMQDCFDVLNPDYVTLYDHPDKYINRSDGGNPYIEGFGEITRLVKSNLCHWKLTNSTTMTFAAKLKTLKDDFNTILNYVYDDYPKDFAMFLDLNNNKGRSLLSSVPGYSTHGETAYLSPFSEWEVFATQNNIITNE